MQSGGSMDRMERVREGAGGAGWYIPGGGGSPWPDHKERQPDQRSASSLRAGLVNPLTPTVAIQL